MLPDYFCSNSLLFKTIYFQLSKNYCKTLTQIIFSIQTTHKKFILGHLQLFLQITAFIFALCSTSLFSNVKTEHIFSTARMDNRNGNFFIGSFYECTSSQIIFVLLLSQVSSLIMGQLDPRSHAPILWTIVNLLFTISSRYLSL